jgi:bacterioferritin (cytochrome b1)
MYGTNHAYGRKIFSCFILVACFFLVYSAPAETSDCAENFMDIKLDDERRQQIIGMLQENMNAEFKATLQYICHRISVYSRDSVLGESFKSAALDEMAHILYFSDMIDKLGGNPEFSEWPIHSGADIAGMLEADIVLEREARTRYSAQLENLGDVPQLHALVESVLSDEQDHEEEFSAYLERHVSNERGQKQG